MKKVGGRCLATHGWNAEDICCFPLSAFYLLLLEYASTPTVCWLGGAVSHCSLLFPSWREAGWGPVPTRPPRSSLSGRISCWETRGQKTLKVDSFWHTALKRLSICFCHLPIQNCPDSWLSWYLTVEIIFLKKILIYFWLLWILVAALSLSLVAEWRGGHSLSWCMGLSLRWWFLLLRSTGSRR